MRWPTRKLLGRHLPLAGRLAAAFLLGSALGLVLRLALFVVSTVAIDGVAWLAGALLGLAPTSDPIYTRAALLTLGGIEVDGLAVAGPPGEALRALLPSMFVEASRADGALVRVAVAPGSAVLARLVAAALTHAGVLAIGVVIVHLGTVRRQVALRAVGLAIQLQVAIGIVAAMPSIQDLEATGLSFAVNVLMPWLTQRRVALSDLVAGIPVPVLDASLVSLALAVGYALAAAAILGVVLGQRSVGRLWPRPVIAPPAGAAGPRNGWWATVRPPLLVIGLSAALAAYQPVVRPSQPALYLEGPTTALAPPPMAAGTDVTSSLAAGAASTPAPDDAGVRQPAIGTGAVHDSWAADAQQRGQLTPGGATAPSRVQITGSNYQYQYLVNGERLVIRGMGLNTQYARFLNPEQRRNQLESDFATFRDLGVNTVLGWDPAEFDAVLLDVAAKYGIGVVVPFDLDPKTDYSDPVVAAGLRAEILETVRRYRNHPALRMWGLGNEVLHKIVNPSWLGPEDPARAQKARAFAAWLIDTADAINALDPDHPVTYRTAEDAYMTWIAEALRARGGPPRPWFLLGVNCYQKYLATLIDRWPSQGMDLPLWVSEFAPGGAAVPDRPRGFRKMWGYIRRYPERVLGGAVYTWTRNGPEEIDRTFGLTDDGVPVDGRSLETLGSLFRGQWQAPAAAAGVPTAPSPAAR